jgi:hypothetical protein
MTKSYVGKHRSSRPSTERVPSPVVQAAIVVESVQEDVVRPVEPTSGSLLQGYMDWATERPDWAGQNNLPNRLPNRHKD